MKKLYMTLLAFCVSCYFIFVFSYLSYQFGFVSKNLVPFFVVIPKSVLESMWFVIGVVLPPLFIFFWSAKRIIKIDSDA